METRRGWWLCVWVCVALLAAGAAAQRHRDEACATVRCMDGFRCKNGQCIQQRFKPEKKFCMPHDYKGKVKRLQCQEQDRKQRCLGAKNVLTCGFTSKGGRIDFTNDCSPCLDPTVKSFVRLPCQDAPTVCLESQECVNGKCFAMFDDDSDDNRNREVCNKSGDCDEDGEICVANKCVERRELLTAFRRDRSARNNYNFNSK